jgi:asparagine synthase (glutamine-hydrolysing)
MLDQTLVEFLYSIPSDQLLRPGDRRSLMRRALAGIVPEEILSRRSKQFESRGYIVTVCSHWKQIAQIITCPLISEWRIADQAKFYEALDDIKKGHMTRDSMPVLRALFLELWLRNIANKGLARMPINLKYMKEKLSATQISAGRTA